MLYFFFSHIHSLARKNISAASSVGEPPEAGSDLASPVESLCRTFYMDSALQQSVPDDLPEVSAPDAASETSSGVEVRPVTSTPGSPLVCSGESSTQGHNVSKRVKRKKNDIDDLMMETLAANRQRLNELTAGVAAVDEDEHFLLSLKGLLGKLDERKKEHIKSQIHSLLVEAVYPKNGTDA